MPNTTASTQPRSRVQVFAIRSEADHALALAEIAALMDQTRLAREGEDRLEILSTLVEAYEEAHHPIPSPRAADAIVFRLEQLGLTTKALEPILGSRARVHEILTGKRTLSAQMMKKLHQKFAIPLESLIEAAAKRVGRNMVRARAAAKPRKRQRERASARRRSSP